jgi:hypothetical protein
MLTRQVVRCRPGLWPRNGRQSRGHYRKRFGAHHRKLSRGTRLSPERRPVGSFPTPRTTPLPLHVDRLRDQLNYSQQIPPRQCASDVEHRNSGQKKGAAGARLLCSGWRCDSVGCAPSVRAVQSTLPRRPSGGRRAKLLVNPSPKRNPRLPGDCFRVSCATTIHS